MTQEKENSEDDRGRLGVRGVVKRECPVVHREQECVVCPGEMDVLSVCYKKNAFLLDLWV